MNYENFNEMTIEEKVAVINSLYKEKRNLKAVGEVLKISGSSLSNKLKDWGYVCDKTLKYYYKVEEEKEMFTKKNSIVNEEDLSDLMLYKDILVMIAKERYAGMQTNSIDFSPLDSLNDEDVKTKSFVIHTDVLAKFEDLCKKYKRFKKQDILSVALLEFIDRYGDKE